MVRKDVKIGAAVFGVLLLVLIVYVLVVPGDNAPNAGLRPGESAMPVVEPVASNTNANRNAANQPANLGGTSTQPPGQTSGGSQVALNQGTTGGRTDPFGPAGADERWMMALNNGVLTDRVTPANSGASTLANNAMRPPNNTPGALRGNAPLALDSTTRPTATRTHVVQPGESLARIAENVYGSQVYYKQIMDANPGIRPERLKPGMIINLPDAKVVKSTGNTDDPTPPPAVDSRTEYRVQSGDSLHKIAQKLYGKTDLWEKIYELNKAKIGNDPARLKLGMVLQLPQAPTR